MVARLTCATVDCRIPSFVFSSQSLSLLCVCQYRHNCISTCDAHAHCPVPQFYGRIDEKFAEWVIDVMLWQVGFKEEDRDRLGPKLYRRGLHGQPKIIVKTKLGTIDLSQFTVDNIIQCLQDNGYGETARRAGTRGIG